MAATAHILNIITPCSRPWNLKAIEASIRIPREHFRWLLVFDAPEIPKDVYLPPCAESYACTVPGSTVGHGQRNFALDKIQTGLVYMNDDDTVLHEDLWGEIFPRAFDYDFISFDQNHANDTPRIDGKHIGVNCIDSHNFMVSAELCRDIRWRVELYEADGHFASACHAKAAPEKRLYIPKVLSRYNALR